jgi:PAS domain S-box-containing protein
LSRKRTTLPLNAKPAQLRRQRETGSSVSATSLVQEGFALSSSPTDATENNYLTITEYSPSMIFVNQNDRVVYANRKCEEIMGYTKEEFYAPGFKVPSIMTPESTVLFADNFVRQQQGKDVPPCEYTLVTKAGARLDTIITTKIIPYAGSSGILGIVTDISENKWIENERNRYMEHLSFLSRSAMHFVRHESDDNIYHFIAEHLKPLIRNAMIAVGEYNVDAGTMIFREACGDAATTAAVERAIGRQIKGSCFPLARSAVAVRHEGRLAKFDKNDIPVAEYPILTKLLRSLEDEFGSCRLYYMPLTVNGDVLGSIAVMNHGDAPLENIGLIEAFINQAAVALKQRNAVEALRRREQEFRALSENSPDIIVRINADLRLAYVNPSITKITSIPRMNFINRSFRELGVPDEIVSRWEETFHTVFRNAVEKAIEFSFETSNGLRYYHARIVPEFSKTGSVDSLLAIAQDITHRKISEEKLERAAAEWRTTFDAISDLISIRDRDLRILRVNRAFAAAYHATPEELIGRLCYEICAGSAARCPGCLQPRVLATQQTVTKEFRRQKEARWFEETISPVFNDQGELVFTIHVDQEITERKKAEEIMKRDNCILEHIVSEKTEELIRARKKLEDVQRLSDIGILAATIAHEIRNPLAAIKTAAYNIRRKSQTSILEHHIGTIDKKVDESDQIIKNLLSYSRIKMPNYEWVTVAALLEECIVSTGEKYSKWEVQIVRHIECGSGDIIEADPVHVKALFSNLLDNAYQAMPDKKGTVTVAAKIAGNTFSVSFRDTGSGIDKADLARITEPFFTRKSRGTGLGLTVCSQIVHLHNGTIAFESEKNKGTCVTITLPLRKTAGV